MYNPGDKVMVSGSMIGTVVKCIGGNDYIVSTSKGQFATDVRSLAPIVESPAPEKKEKKEGDSPAPEKKETVPGGKK